MENVSFSKAGSDWCEDRCFVCDDFGYVLDGATSMFAGSVGDKHSSAEWWSSKWDKYLKTALKDKDKAITQILRNGIKKFSKEILNFLDEDKQKDFPNTTIALFRKQKGYFEFYVLGDSPLYVETASGNVIEFEDTQNVICDSIKMEIVKSKLNGKDFVNARYDFKDLFLKFRHELNHFGGAYALSGDEESVNHGIYRVIPSEIVKKIVAVSDGFSAYYDIFKLENKEDFVKKTNTTCDVQSKYDKMFLVQEDDANCNKFPRFKKRDDASIIIYYNNNR